MSDLYRPLVLIEIDRLSYTLHEDRNRTHFLAPEDGVACFYHTSFRSSQILDYAATVVRDWRKVWPKPEWLLSCIQEVFYNYAWQNGAPREMFATSLCQPWRVVSILDYQIKEVKTYSTSARAHGEERVGVQLHSHSGHRTRGSAISILYFTQWSNPGQHSEVMLTILW